MTARNLGDQSGFTLLEAVVAVAILAAALIPLYDLVNRSLDGLFRAAEINRESEAKLVALGFLGGINPTERPTGEEQIGDYVIRWQSTDTIAPLDAVAYPRGIGIYQVALYRTDVTVLRGGRTWFAFPVRLVGHKMVRQLVPFS